MRLRDLPRLWEGSRRRGRRLVPPEQSSRAWMGFLARLTRSPSVTRSPAGAPARSPDPPHRGSLPPGADPSCPHAPSRPPSPCSERVSAPEADSTRRPRSHASHPRCSCLKTFHPHNLAVQVWAELGLVGAILAVGVNGLMLRTLSSEPSDAFPYGWPPSPSLRPLRSLAMEPERGVGRRGSHIN